MAMYRCGSNSGGGVTPTPITPSDSTPAALTANTPVNPTANGYAIESQPQNVTPSTSGAAFNGGIINMSSGGYAYSQQPSGATPEILDFKVVTSGAAPTISISDNTESTLYAITYTSSSSASTRETNTNIASHTGCDVTLVDSILTGTTLLRFYKLTNCQSSVSVTTGSASTNTGKNIMVFKMA